MKEKAKWTFMVYLAGDNNLSTAGDKDLREMRSVGSTADVNIVAEFDNAGDRGTTRYHIQRNGVNEHVKSIGETDSGDPKVLLDFVTWAAERYPAERYALVLWNHGGGWEPSEMNKIARSASAVDYNTREAGERSASPLGRVFFRTTLEKIYQLPSVEERAICSDDGTGHSLDTIELGNVLSSIVDLLGQPLDLMGMDACLMSNLEVAYQARPYVKYIVASEESEPNDGWPYDTISSELVTNPGSKTAELAEHIVNAYIKSYVDRHYSGPVTQAALNLSKTCELADQLDSLADVLTAHMDEAVSEIWTAQRKSARFWHNTLWDVAHFCEELEKATSNNVVGEAALNVRKALKTDPDNFVIAEKHNGKTVEHCGGVTIYMPSISTISPFYADLDYAKEHKWLNMLKAYQEA